MREIHRATKNFSPTLKIGQGGFGVYKGTLDDGMVSQSSAPRRASTTTIWGQNSRARSRCWRRSSICLVRFHGYLEHEDERIIVVEYVPNGTLREHLDCVHGNHLDLAARLDIAIDVAHAVTYLHMYADHPIIHEISSHRTFSLRRTSGLKLQTLGSLGGVQRRREPLTFRLRSRGLQGIWTRSISEPISSRRERRLLLRRLAGGNNVGKAPIEPKRGRKERITPKWAMHKFMDGDAVQVLDPNLSQSRATNVALEKILELALQCLAPTKEGRPSMKRCAEILWSIRKNYRELASSDSLSQSEI
ncbi:calmodulin-binding receptor-like cytoplasmic kinase 2 [Iris pallida]|uniref:Calmodulin-binding receptor-like cytoplasmic kinase 2 n=1 Tax=Iris pallida TaxID=29817 RepID=A0AAX6IC97_IRIPA|nr:calmodulin-binding receptor-like cytoplasmic kinase 2 [Iris pallida]